MKSVKRVFYAVLGLQKLSDELLRTVFCSVEQNLNARPLVPASSNPNDLEALTPNHFLLGRPSISIPPYMTDQTHFNHRAQFVKAEAFSNAKWQRWLKEYADAERSVQKANSWSGAETG